MAHHVYDLRNITPRSNGTRLISAIKNIARHHSASVSGGWDSFWNFWHGTRGWGTGGYHEIILRDGSVQLCYDPHEITNGVANNNTGTFHICVVGNGQFTEAQERTFYERCTMHLARFNLPISAVKGHREFPGQSTACPGIDMNLVRKCLKEGTLPRYTEQIDPMDKNYLIEGDVGTSVSVLQTDLNNFAGILKQPRLVADGIFGAATEKLLKLWQKEYDLKDDGIYGAKSQAMMKKQLADLRNPVKVEWFRVRTSWANVNSQKGAFINLEEAKAFVDKLGDGHKVYDDGGVLVYNPKTAPVPKPEPLEPVPVNKPDKPKEEKHMEENVIILNDVADYFTARKLHVRTGYKIMERAAVKGKVGKHLIIVGGGKKGLEKAGETFTDLSGPTWEKTGDNVEAYVKSL